MEKDYFVKARFEKMHEYSDLVNFFYKEGPDYKEYMCMFKFTYSPETKEWTPEESDTYSQMRDIEELTGLHRSEFPKLMRERMHKEFRSRGMFYDNVYSLLNKESLTVSVEEVRYLEGDIPAVMVSTLDSDTGLELNLLFEEEGQLSHCNFRKEENGTIANYMTFRDSAAFPLCIKDYARFLLEESEYRIKLLLL